MKTPLYKNLKTNGITTFTFPSAVDDISNATKSGNADVFFSKYSLINLPKQKISPDVILDYRTGRQFSVDITKTVPLQSGSAVVTDKEPVVFDFDNAFFKNNLGSIQSASTFGEQLVESLRNYVANQEVMIRNTKTSNNNYFFDTTILKTPTERIFFKWAKKLNLIQFEEASTSDEYFSTLSEFDRINLSDDTYLNEYLWKEREVIDFIPYTFDTSSTYTNKLQVAYNTQTNYRVGDVVKFYNFSNDASASQNIHDLSSIPSDLTNYYTNVEVIAVIAPSNSTPQYVIFDCAYTTSLLNNTNVKTKLVYNTFVQYIGEITNTNTIKKADGTSTEVIAHISDNQGKTPDVLFRTLHDNNYEPNLGFPILAQQFQPEIFGAEVSTSPIVSSPNNYAGDYYAQYDKDNNDDAYNYLTTSGDINRKSGEYFGVTGDINNKIFNANKIDGISLDFNVNHYIKMNLANTQVTNFDDFNGLALNNEPPKDFEFNAIMWYYTIVDSNNNSATNLYGIQILDNPINNQNPNLKNIQIPTYKKYVNDGLQDGTSYQFSLKYEYDMDDENYVPMYDPNSINNLNNFSLYNEAMRKLAQANSSFFDLIKKYNTLATDLNSVKKIMYNQQDITTINTKIKSLEDLIKLYKTLQLSESDTIYFENNLTTTPPTLQINSKDQVYSKIDVIETSILYNGTNIVPYDIDVILAKNFLVRIINDDIKNINLSANNHLSVILNRDLDYKQTVKFDISTTNKSTQNKQLDIYIKYDSGVSNSPITTKLIKTIDLPVGFNITANTESLATKLSDISLNIGKVVMTNATTIDIYTIDNAKSLIIGEYIYLNNFTQTNGSVYIDYSNLYYIKNITINTVPNMPSYIKEYVISVNVENKDLLSYIATLNINDELNINNSSFITLLKKWTVEITRIEPSSTSTFDSRYDISIKK